METEMGELILLRHGASAWNEKNLFTGWVDVPLSSKGIEEAEKAALFLSQKQIDGVFTSTLIRAKMTATLALMNHLSGKILCFDHHQEGFEGWSAIHSSKTQEEVFPVTSAWQLNERMYGELQGMNKDEMRLKYGVDQVHRWRRSFDEAPPGGESLKMTSERTLPFFKEQIVPLLQKKKNILVVAHGNSLRSIVMMLENLSKEQVVQLEIPTGEPWVYQFHQEQWRRLVT